MRGWLFLALVGCAQAGAPGGFGNHEQPDGGGMQPMDAPMQPMDAPMQPMDAPMQPMDAPTQPDAPTGPMTITLDEASSDTLVEAASEACPASTGEGTAANYYYRVFFPSDFGVTTTLTVTHVDFQVEDSESDVGSVGTGVNVTVKVGLYTGATAPNGSITTSNLASALVSKSVAVPEVDESNGDPGIAVDVPVSATIPAGDALYFEIDSAQVTNAALYMGVSTSGEPKGESFIEAPHCGASTPTYFSTQTGTEDDLLMTVTGTY